MPDAIIKRGVARGVEWIWAGSSKPRGIVFVPPLIGGHALQQIRVLRPLVRRNLDLLSFNYAGHGNSAGPFCLQNSVDNCLTLMDRTVNQSRKANLPIFGVASCYGALPMLHALGQLKEPLSKLVLINAVPHWRWNRLAASFIRYWQNSSFWKWDARGLKRALHDYVQDLFPNVAHRRQAFGILSRHRIHWPRLLAEVLLFGARHPSPLSTTPVLCIYGRRDRLLQQAGFEDRAVYEALIERICPQARFQRMDGDHFFSGAKIRRKLINRICQYFTSNA